ncbi:MAG: FAD-dependent oxidoreductase [Elusimicrobia bacterium]|nr:FAD-dependent oxidoreductase [Elusimicrobiota bacterium]
MTPARVLIIGAGMSGLSCAYHLKRDFLLLEREGEPGGLSRSIQVAGFTFDHTGHLLHLRHPYTTRLVPRLLKGNLLTHQRNAWIYSHGVFTRYPFQANTFGLPRKVVKECVEGFLEAQMVHIRGRPSSSRISFHEWVLATFGNGFGRHFFFPYNQKLWTVPPHVLTAEWVAPFVPRPTVEEVLTGAFTDQTKAFGYNATFSYPQRGGIQALAWAFARRLGIRVRYHTEIVQIRWKRQEVVLSNGERLRYQWLVSTLPLPRLLETMEELPSSLRRRAQQLRWNSVLCLNLGVARPHVSDKHWVYFPERQFPFYRVGFSMNFSPYSVPPGCSSLYVEFAHSPATQLDRFQLFPVALQGLYRSGLLQRSDALRVIQWLPLPFAYVIYDRHRTPAVKDIFNFLRRQRIVSIGRFGAWKYSYMEEAILDGKATAEAIA